LDETLSLTRAIASGDPEAFARLYRERFGLILGIVRKTTRFPEDQCLDVVQDAMLRVIRFMKPIRTAPALEAWLARVARTTAYDFLRHERRRLMHERAAGNGRMRESTDEIKDVDERLESVRRDLLELDGVTAGILELRFRTGLTLDAIGRRLGLKPGAVHGRMARGLEKLRQRRMHDDE